MPLGSNLDTSSVGVIATQLASLTPAQFVASVRALKDRFPGLDWQTLLGSALMGAGLAADGAALPSLAEMSAGVDRENNLTAWLATNPRGHIEVVDPTDFQWSFRARTAAAGSLNNGAPQVAPGAARRVVLQGGVWCVAAGAAAQGVIDLDIACNNGATTLFSLEAAAVAGTVAVVPFRCNIKTAALNQTLDVLQVAAPAANTVQSLSLYGYIE